MIENDQIYADSCFPTQQFRVSGVRLEPLSIGHTIILQSLNSPFLDFRTPEFSDLMDALWICSRPVEPNVNTATRPLPWRWRFWSKRLQKIADKEPERTWVSIQMLQEYIFDSLWFKPPISTKNSQICRQSSCPTMIPMVRSLQNHWGYSEREALNMPLKKAKMLHAAWLEHEGALSFTTQADKDVIERMKDPANIAWNKKIREEAAKKVAAREAAKKK